MPNINIFLSFRSTLDSFVTKKVSHQKNFFLVFFWQINKLSHQRPCMFLMSYLRHTLSL